MRRKLIAANWKMHKNSADVSAFFSDFSQQTLPTDRDIVIAASFPLIPAVVSEISSKNLPIIPAAQNVSAQEEGAFTGEVSAEQLANIGCKMVIIGHSERRTFHNETDEQVNQKLQIAFQHGLTPILCVGEQATERSAGTTQNVVQRQVTAATKGISPENLAHLVVAYEPVWAIGTGEHPTNEQIEEVFTTIRQSLPSETRILYGGSVSAETAAGLWTVVGLDGFLVGGASLDANAFYSIVTA